MPGQEELREMKAALAERLRKVGVAGSEAPPSGEAEKLAEINRLSRNLEMLEAEDSRGGLVGKLAALKAAEIERARCEEAAKVRESQLHGHEAPVESMAPVPRRCPHCGGVIG
jgi:hypothetical protein